MIPQNAIWGIVLFAALSSCSSGIKENPTDTATTGETKIAVDESYSLLFDTEIFTFQALYKYAKVNVRYLPEELAMQELLNDSVRFAVVCRQLNENEKKYFASRRLIPRLLKIASDAACLIVHPSNPDSLFTMPRLHEIFSGRDSLWKAREGKSEKIKLVFDHPLSANARFLREKLLDGRPLPSNAYALSSSRAVVDFVNQNPGAIGIISVNWISDRDDSISRGFLNKVKVAAISSGVDGEFVRPWQAYIKTGKYPLCRDVFIVSREARAGLATGFSAFVAGDKGQLIILKAGLVPAVAPVRIVEVKNK